MEVYTTENEQVDAVRRFFAENGKALAIGVVVGIAALGGWHYWQTHENTALTEASASYQQASTALTSNKADGVANLEKFAQTNSNSYGVFAALQLADHFVEAKDFVNAEKQLTQASQLTKDENLLSLVNYRLARVQLQQNKLDDALKTLDNVKGDGWMAMQQEVRGDVLLAKGDTKGARDAYSKGLDSKPSQTLQTMLRMKLNNLSS
ncbi:YfgM family protein [Rouxiella badensis]|uniref:YfgM family protein n=1 Tax=Rouxiella badensis TaxID=1646377 RepID=UPI00037E6C56|nr:YfgM family protein [Rouxiella badensis]MCC3704059.1 YfgM family protein [Rouxiella badensis]MCC3719080.1 YfgM family protein [Rouxiella badensis]MCC3729134.1 YfgM family protein [Rouxiella badensis]MCC3733667.1 YfgM family protein [Rouxiella badensis]MCC3740685.1 YfgM family protein [Rouxiella badensis]